jgi:transcription initiation factor IIE alpha subunit
MYHFQIKINGVIHDYILHKREIDVLQAMARVHEMKGLATSENISLLIGRPNQLVRDVMKRLRIYKLVASCEWTGSMYDRGRRKFTLTGVAVLAAYDNKLYRAPDSEQETTFIPEQVNHRII